MFMHGELGAHRSGTCSSSGSSATTSRTRSGRVRFLIWYLAAGLAATALQTVVTLAPAPRGREHPERRRERRDRRRARRLLRAAPARARADARLPRLHLPASRSRRVVFLGIWFGFQLISSAALAPASAGGRRRRVLRAHRRVRLRRVSRAAVQEPRLRRARVLMTLRGARARRARLAAAGARRALENVAVVVGDEHPRGSRPLRPVRGTPLPELSAARARQITDLPAAARGVVSRSCRARGGDPHHRAARAGPLLRHRRGPARQLGYG